MVTAVERRLRLPPVGLGCSPYRQGAAEDLGPAIGCALRLGYRLVDGAEMYGNERQIGRILSCLAAMEELHGRGLASAIGVSNFRRRDLELLLAEARILPAVNQIERHPHRPQSELVGFSHRRGIRVMAHSPLSAPGLLKEPVLKRIGNQYGKSSSQVVLRWNLENEVVPVPSSTQLSHLAENIDIFDFRLTSEEMAAIDGLGRSLESGN